MELVAIDRYVRQEAVVQRSLHQIGVAGIARQRQHAPVPSRVSNCFARLQTCAQQESEDTRMQLEGVFACQLAVLRVHGQLAGEMQLAGCHVTPDGCELVHEFLVACFRVVVGAGAHEVCLTYNMPAHVAAEIGADNRGLSQQWGEEMSGAGKISLFARGAVEFDQRHFDDAVPGKVFPLKPLADCVGNTLRAFQEFGRSGCTVVRNGGLDHMARVTQSVRSFEIVAIVGSPECVVLMRIGNAGHKQIEQGARIRIVPGLQDICARFQPFLKVRAPGMAVARAVHSGGIGLERFQAGRDSRLVARRVGPEGRGLVVYVQPRQEGRDAIGPAGIHARFPEPITHDNGLHWDRFERGKRAGDGGHDAGLPPMWDVPVVCHANLLPESADVSPASTLFETSFHLAFRRAGGEEGAERLSPQQLVQIVQELQIGALPAKVVPEPAIIR